MSRWYLRLIWGFASLFMGVYAILQDLNIPLIVQPQLFGFLAFVSWGQVSTLTLRVTSVFIAVDILVPML